MTTNNRSAALSRQAASAAQARVAARQAAEARRAAAGRPPVQQDTYAALLADQLAPLGFAPAPDLTLYDGDVLLCSPEGRGPLARITVVDDEGQHIVLIALDPKGWVVWQTTFTHAPLALVLAAAEAAAAGDL